MEHKKDIIKMAKKIFSHRKKVANAKLVHPERDWLVGLAVALLFLIANAFWSYQTYYTYRNPNLDTNTNTGNDSLVVYHTFRVESVLRNFSEREKEHQQLLKKLSSGISILNSEQQPKIIDNVTNGTSTDTTRATTTQSQSETEIASSTDQTKETAASGSKDVTPTLID